MISKAIVKMKTGKASGPSGIVIEMIRSPGKEIVKYYKPCNHNNQGRLYSFRLEPVEYCQFIQR